MSKGLSATLRGWLLGISAVLVKSIRAITGTNVLKEHIDKRFNEIDKRFNEIDKRFNEIGLRLSANDVAIMNKLLELDQKMNGIEHDMVAFKDSIEKHFER